MPVLTEIDILRDLLTAHRIRIAELELQRDSACRALLDAERVLRDVVRGMPLDEQLRASVGLGNVLRILRTQPQPVAEPEAVRDHGRRYAPRLMVVKP